MVEKGLLPPPNALPIEGNKYLVTIIAMAVEEQDTPKFFRTWNRRGTYGVDLRKYMNRGKILF